MCLSSGLLAPLRGRGPDPRGLHRRLDPGQIAVDSTHH